MTTYEITAHGQTHTRQSDTRYVAASVRQDGTVRWHATVAAARRAAGRYGRIVDVSDQAPARPVADDDATYRIETSDRGSITIWREADGRRSIVDKFPAGTDDSRVQASIDRDRARR